MAIVPIDKGRFRGLTTYSLMTSLLFCFQSLPEKKSSSRSNFCSTWWRTLLTDVVSGSSLKTSQVPSMRASLSALAEGAMLCCCEKALEGGLVCYFVHCINQGREAVACRVKLVARCNAVWSIATRALRRINRRFSRHRDLGGHRLGSSLQAVFSGRPRRPISGSTCVETLGAKCGHETSH